MTFIYGLRTSSLASVTGTTAHLTTTIIDDALKKPSGEKAGEKGLFSAAPVARLSVFFTHKPYVFVEAFDFKQEIFWHGFCFTTCRRLASGRVANYIDN